MRKVLPVLLTAACLLGVGDGWAQSETGDSESSERQEDASAVADGLRSKILGAWTLQHEVPNPEGHTYLKFWGARHWAITTYTRDGEIHSHHGGTYTLDGNEYTETIEYAAELTKTWIGRKFRFTIDVEGDRFTQQGIDNEWNETWKRLGSD